MLVGGPDGGALDESAAALLELRRSREQCVERHAADRAAVQAVLAAQDANVGRLIAERDAARVEVAALENERAVLTEIRVNAAHRVAVLRSLLAIEPAVSEERLASDIGGALMAVEYQIGGGSKAHCVVRDAAAAARQLHALRAELVQIVSGGLPDARDKAGPIAWAVTGSRVTTLTWIAERLAGAAMDPERDREAAQVIAGLLSETSP